MTVKMNPDELEFLCRLRDGRRLSLADRAEDRARQWCRRAGLAEVLQKPRRWALTKAGRLALTQSTEARDNISETGE